MRLTHTLLTAISILLLSACATKIAPKQGFNPPPAERFAAFGKFELKPVTLAPAYADNAANKKAAAKIQEHFDTRMQAEISQWNSKASTNERTLLIEPRIEEIKFINGAARFWAGAMAGSSAVIMHVSYTDKATGKVIATPEFFQRAAAMSGALTMGGQDNAMLARIVTLVADYTTRNYLQAVGGESGGADFVRTAAD